MVKRTIALLLAVMVMIGIIPSKARAEELMPMEKLGIEEHEVEPCTQSRTSGFSKNYTLTGNGAHDMVAIALAQEGRTGSDFGYTEEWCADFVSDCAILAGQDDVIPQYGGVSGLYDRILSAGGKITTSDPKPGDICFINWDGNGSMGHVEIVYSVSDGNVYTIGGNSGSGHTLYTRCVKKHAPLSREYIVVIVRPKYCDHPYYGYHGEGVCNNCGEIFEWSLNSAESGIYKVLKNFTPRVSGPYDASTKDTQTTVKKGEEIEVKGSIQNAYGNKWYQIVYRNGKNGYVYHDFLQFYEYGAQEISCTISSPAEGAIVPQKSYPVIGTVTSKYPLKKVDAYIDGRRYASVTVDNKCTLDLRSSAINDDLDFSSLSVGSHTLVIKAQDIHHSELVQVIRRDFSVENSPIIITFYANGGECDTSELKVTQGSAIGILPEAYFGFMGFEGWYTEPYGGKQVTAETVPTGDMELWARYSHCASEVKLEFDPNGGIIPGAVLSEVIDGVNRGRPGESLVVFNKAGTKPGTNIYGVEAAVNSSGQIVGWRDYGDKNQLTVPEGGFILSGQAGWNSDTGTHVGGVRFMWDIDELLDAGKDVYVSMNYETGEVKVFDSYAGYLAEIKRGQEYTRYGVLPVPVREGYTFRGWRDIDGYDVDYYSGFSGIYLVAVWDENTDLYPTATMEYNGHYYEVYDHNVTWTEARALCESMGGYLVTITSAAEQTAIMALLEDSRRGSYRIGATDEQSEGTWTWVNGETFSYNNWDPDYPEPNTAEGKNYASIIAIDNPPNKQVGEWYVSNAVYYSSFYDLSNTGFICEYDHPFLCDHRYSYEVLLAPSEDTTGILREQCNACGEYTDIILPVLNKTDYEYTVLIESTCTEEGLALYRWRVANGSSFDFAVQLPVADHNYTGVRMEATCEMPAMTRYTCSYCGDRYDHYEGDYSDWTEVYPEGVDPALIETRVEYRFKQKEFTTGPESSMDGWTLYDTTTKWGEYGAWSEWSTTKPTASDSVKVEERTVYGYYYYLCSSCGAHMHGYGNCWTWAGGCGAKTTNSGWHAVWSTISWDKANLKDWHGTGKYYTYIDGELVFKWTDGGSKTEYRYCSRELETVYYFYRWTDWTAWTPVEVFADDNTMVENRTVYRYISGGFGEHQYTEEIKAPTCTEEGYTVHTCTVCGETYMDSYVDAMDHDFVDGVCTRCGAEDPNASGSEIASGWSGATEWTLTSDGVLTIYGKGNMKNYGWGGNQPWSQYADQVTTVIIEDGITSVGSGAFKGMTGLASVELPDSLTQIGIAAFYGCTSLEEIYIPDGIYTIWEYTFKNCTSLENVRLPKTLIKIDQGAFEACISLTELFLPTNTQIIGGWSFKGCTSLESVDMQWADATEIRAGAFKNCSSLTTIQLPANIQVLGDSCFYGIGATSFTVPDTVTSIEAWCFARAYSLKNLYFEGDAPTIGQGAFNKITLTAHYPGSNSTWIAEIMQNYGGTVTWEAQ